MPPRKRTTGRAVAGPAKPVPITSALRNTAKDREFIEDHKFEFRVFEGQLVWTGRSEDIGSPYQLPPDQNRCTYSVTRRDDEGKPILDADLQQLKVRCPKWGMLLPNGMGVLHLCSDHAGGVAGVKRAFQERLAGAADAMASRLIQIALSPNTEPSDAIRAIKEALDRIGIRGGVEISPDVPGWQQVWKELAEGRDGTEDGRAEAG